MTPQGQEHEGLRKTITNSTFNLSTWWSLEWDNTNPFLHHLLPLQTPPALCPGEEGLFSVCESLGGGYDHNILGWMGQNSGGPAWQQINLRQQPPTWAEKLILENKKEHKFLFLWPLLHSQAHFKHLEHCWAVKPWRCLWYAQHHSQIPRYFPVYRSTGKTSLTCLS